MNKRLQRLTACIIALEMIVTGSLAFDFTAKADTCGGLEEVDIYEPREGDVIKDPVLHWAVRSALNQIKDAPILTEEIVGSRNVQDISYELCAHPENFESWTKQYWIESFEGIQYAKSANMIDICYTNATEGKKIADLSPLSALTQLRILFLKQDGISDIKALEPLVNLEQLDLSENKEISDVTAIRDMRKLKRLGLGYNQISDVSAVSGLTELEYINLANNQLVTLPDLSQLKKAYHLDVSGNRLTNADVEKIAAMKGLRELAITNNPQITDVKPLAGLLYLEKDKTFLPVSAEEKDNLFAAIEVNKLFNLFNISRMKESDLENVGKALAAYESLTDEQKRYIDEKRVEAAKSNQKLVESGAEPKYYEEYDEGGENQPVFDRLEIKVVDKYGKALPGVDFRIEKEYVTSKATSDENGVLTVKHLSWDFGEASVAPEGDSYVSVPEKITYEVQFGRTYAVNGKLATGLEKLQFVLIPKSEYVDKTQLEQALSEAETVDEEYRYTSDTYRTYADALAAAQKARDDVDASKNSVDTAAENLRKAIGALKKSDVLTALKLKVVDQDGNTFTRPFKFQIYVPQTRAEAWNEFSDAHTGYAYLKASPLWADGKTWQIVPCYEEPYTFETFTATVGVKNGQRYFKSVNGQSVGLDFTRTVTVTPRAGGAEDKEHERQPDSTVLKEYTERAETYLESDYTASTYAKLAEAIEKANAALGKSGASQEDYDQAAADLLRAETGLTAVANKLELGKAIERSRGYSEEYYTAESWSVFETALKKAESAQENAEISQTEVDQAVSELKKAEDALIFKADKTELGEMIASALALKEEDYISGYDGLQAAIGQAQQVYDNDKATSSQVSDAMKKLSDAMNALKKKPVEPEYSCDPGVFRALIQNEAGEPLAGVWFEAYTEGVSAVERLKSDADGILVYYINGNYRGKKTTIRLVDKRYETQDEHWFTVDGISQWICEMKTVDDTPYQSGLKLSYTLKETGLTDPGLGTDPDNPNPDPTNPGADSYDRAGLQEEIDIVDSMSYRSGDYTEESWKNLQDVLAEAKKVCEDEQAEQETINEWAKKLREARENLVEAKKPVVCDKSNIRILIENEKGERVTEEIPFTIALDSQTLNPYSRDGIVEYPLTDADYGVEKVTVAPLQNRIEIDGTEYIISPEKHEFSLDSSTLGVEITAIDGEMLTGSRKVSFVLHKAESDPEGGTGSEEGKDPNQPGSEKPEFGNQETAGRKIKVNSITISGISKKIAAGKKIALQAEIQPANADNKNVIWTSNNSKVASVSGSGIVTMKKKSGGKKVTITATAADGSGVKATYQIKSMKNAVKKVSLNAKKSVKAGKSVKVKATVKTTGKKVNKKLKWTSSDPAYATVNGSGKVKTYKAGKGKTVKITAMATDGSGKKKTVKIKIK